MQQAPSVSTTKTTAQRIQQVLGRHGRFWIIGGVIALTFVIFVWFLFQPSGKVGTPGTLAIGQVAPNFTLNDANGHPMSLAQFKGHPLMLNFWATTCGPCASETPLLQRTVMAHQPQGLVILGIDQGEEDAAIAKFGQDYNLSYPLLADNKLKVNNQYGVTGLPVTYFIDQTGTIRSISGGVLFNNTLAAGLKAIGINP